MGLIRRLIPYFGPTGAFIVSTSGIALTIGVIAYGLAA